MLFLLIQLLSTSQPCFLPRQPGVICGTDRSFSHHSCTFPWVPIYSIPFLYFFIRLFLRRDIASLCSENRLTRMLFVHLLKEQIILQLQSKKNYVDIHYSRKTFWVSVHLQFVYVSFVWFVSSTSGDGRNQES